METNRFKLYNEEDIEIHEDGISVGENFFDKGRIADLFNDLILLNTFMDKCVNE